MVWFVFVWFGFVFNENSVFHGGTGRARRGSRLVSLSRSPAESPSPGSAVGRGR